MMMGRLSKGLDISATRGTDGSGALLTVQAVLWAWHWEARICTSSSVGITIISNAVAFCCTC